MWRRLIIAIFIAVSVAALLVYAKLPALLESVAVAKLEGLGATAIELELNDVGLEATQINKLKFVIEKNARRYTYSSQDMDVSYVLSDLFKAKLDSVNARKISVHIETLPSREENVQNDIPSPEKWLSAIPFKNLFLELLSIELSEDGQSRHIEISGKLNTLQDSASARFDIKTKDYGTQRLELELMPTGNSKLALSDMQTPSEPISYVTLNSGAWTSVDDGLLTEVGVDIDVKKLQQQLQRWGLSMIPEGTSGKLTAHGPLSVDSNNSPTWQSKGNLVVQIPDLKGIGKQAIIDMSFESTVNNKQVQWAIAKGGHGSLKKIKIDKTYVKSAQANLRTKAECRYQLDEKSWSCEPFRLALTVPSVINNKNSINISKANIALTSLVGNNTDWAASMDVVIPNWVVNVGNDKSAKQIKLDRVHGSVDASNHKINAKLALVAPKDGAIVHIKATQELKNNTGKATYRFEPIDMHKHATVFADTYSDWPTKLSLNAGNIGVVGKALWKKGFSAFSQQATMTLQNISGEYGDLNFTGLAGTLDAKGAGKLYIKSRNDFRVDKLNIGTAITDIALSAELIVPGGSKPSGKISDLTMNVLGGKMTGNDLKFDLARTTNPFTLQVTGVDVEELLKLEKKQGLIGSGIIDGELPLVLTDKGIFMQNGRLAARKPGGKLKYSANQRVRGMAESNAGLKMLVTAMDDFSYKVLEAALNYAPNGLLRMKVRLEGSNPELQAGRPVHLNIDIEDNILELLRSLRLASEISEKIGERVQKRQLNK